jgi:cytochrome c heme-lyase
VDDSAKKVWMTAPENPFHNSSSAPESSSSSSVRLANDREISTIPRGAGSMYSHNTDAAPVAAEHEAGGNWVYPSEQQFFNAMMRKKHNPQAKDMKTIVPIHNAVNEKAWEEVLVWEAGMGGEKCPGGIKLSSFVGRPQDRTPKAWMKTIFG